MDSQQQSNSDSKSLNASERQLAAGVSRRRSPGLRSDIGQFGIAPAWLAELTTNARVHQLWNILSSKYADRAGVSWPSIETIQRDMGCSRQTVKNTIALMMRLGVLACEQRKRPNGASATNIYRLFYVEPADDAGQQVSRGGANRLAGEGLTCYPPIDIEPDSLEPVSVLRTTAQTLRFSRQAKAPNGTNYKPIAKLVRLLLTSNPSLATTERYAELVEAAKQQCADLRIDYGRHETVPFDVVHRACASELMKFKLFGAKPDP